MSSGVVTIPKKEYDSLLRDARELEEYEREGVDNWVGIEYIDWGYVETGVRTVDE